VSKAHLQNGPDPEEQLALSLRDKNTYSHIPLEAHEKLMEAFLPKKEMVHSPQDNYTETAHLKIVFTS